MKIVRCLRRQNSLLHQTIDRFQTKNIIWFNYRYYCPHRRPINVSIFDVRSKYNNNDNNNKTTKAKDFKNKIYGFTFLSSPSSIHLFCIQFLLFKKIIFCYCTRTTNNVSEDASNCLLKSLFYTNLWRIIFPRIMGVICVLFLYYFFDFFLYFHAVSVSFFKKISPTHG